MSTFQPSVHLQCTPSILGLLSGWQKSMLQVPTPGDCSTSTAINWACADQGISHHWLMAIARFLGTPRVWDFVTAWGNISKPRTLRCRVLSRLDFLAGSSSHACSPGSCLLSYHPHPHRAILHFCIALKHTLL